MTTHITELAQSLKAAAEKSTPGPWERGDGRHGGELFVYCDDALGSAVCEATSTYNAIPKYQRIHNLDFIAMANPANILALVEALEKAQQNETQASEMAVQLSKRLTAAEKRIAELDSRAVKLPKLKMLEDYLAEVAIEERKQILVGVKLEFHRECAAAGIKVEAE